MQTFRLLLLIAAMLLTGCEQVRPSAGLSGTDPARAQAAPVNTDPVHHAIGALFGDVRTETLANGLRVYLKPIPGSPVVTTKIAYRVGSADEHLDHTGLAHYLEHLMFKGTDVFMPGDIDRITQRNGGSNNAYTDVDSTVYHFDFASDRWEAALKIEADRMRNLRIDEKHEFNIEKGAVVEELRMNEDEPWDAEYKAILPLLFGDGPYGHPVIGEAIHVREATAQVITDFYNRWYHPNNASIIIVGGFDPDAAMKLIHELFDQIPKADLPARPQAKVVTRTKPARKHVDSKFAQPRLLIGFNGVKLGEPDDFVLDVISQILTGGKTSRLYRTMIDDLEIASDVSSSNIAGRHPGWISFDVELLPEQDLDEAEDIVIAALEQLAKEPATEVELARVRRQMSAGMIFHYEDVHDLADAIAFGAVSGQPDYYGKYLSRINEVTAADVQRVAKTLLDPSKRVVVTSSPKSAEAQGRMPMDALADAELQASECTPRMKLAARSNRGAIRHHVPASKRVPLIHRVPLTSGVFGACQCSVKHTSSVSRKSTLTKPRAALSVAPGMAPKLKPTVAAGSFDLAAATHHTLPNGLKVILLENHRLPIIVVSADVGSTRLLEPDNQSGVAALTGRLLSEGAGTRTSEQIATAIEDIGGALSMYASGGEIKILSSDRTLGVQTFFDCLIRPTFADQDFEREKFRLVADREDSEYHPGGMARLAFQQLAYASHPFAKPEEGSAESVSKLTREQCIAFHKLAFVPSNTIVTVVGDFESKSMVEEIKKFTADWKTSEIKLPKLEDPKLPGKIEEHFITMPDSAQLKVLMGHAGVRRSNPDYYKLLVLDYVFGTGTGFTDRLSARIRDRAGLAYSVGGSIAGSSDLEPGVFLCSIGTDAKNYKRVRDEVIEEINRIRNERPTDEEVESAKAYLLGSTPFSLTTTQGASAMLIGIERHHLGANYLDDFKKAVAAVTADDVQAVAKKYLHPDQLIIIAAGSINAKGEPTE